MSSENHNQNILKFDFAEKLEILKNIRNQLKNKRFILDESVDKFGFDKLTLLHTVKNEDEVKGYPFSASKVVSKVLRGLKLALKIVPIELKYDKEEHPTSLEFIALKEFTESLVNKNITPHITYYLGSQKITNKSRAVKFLNLKRLEVEEKIRKQSRMLISEFVPGGSLDKWISDVYDNEKSISDSEWKNIVFQIIYTMSVIQHKYRFMHNDFHYGNILIDDSIKPGGYFVYQITRDNTTTEYYLKNTGIIPKLWDCEFCMCYSDKIPNFFPNRFIIGSRKYDTVKHQTEESNSSDTTMFDSNVPYNYNEVYDLHYFLTSLLDLYISKELFDWILDLYPEELIPREETEDTDSDDSEYSEYSSSDEISKEESDKSSDSESSDSESSDKSSDESSDNESSDSESSDSESSVDSYFDPYLAEGRIRNGVEKEFKNLPTPFKLLESPFFENLKNKPDDFKENESIYFKYSF
jgi:hypothetical protein